MNLKADVGEKKCLWREKESTYTEEWKRFFCFLFFPPSWNGITGEQRQPNLQGVALITQKEGFLQKKTQKSQVFKMGFS